MIFTTTPIKKFKETPDGHHLDAAAYCLPKRYLCISNDSVVRRETTVYSNEAIYRRNYWNRCRCQDLASGLDWAVFDFAVNAGTGRAARTLQKAEGATEDGSIGPLTLMKVKEHEVANVINRIAIYREEFYRSLDTFDTFGRGWLRRNDETRKQALAMG